MTAHENNVPMPVHQRRLLNLICRRRINLILPSNVSRDRFIDYCSSLDLNEQTVHNKVFVIPFGLFETFNCFSDDETVDEENNLILFFGRIFPYKGLNFLIDAIKLLTEKIPSVKLIIAGRGSLGSINDVSESNFEIMNRFIPNIEIIRLIKRSKIVVCPYVSASQSGIPMVSFLYNKPVIATSVGGFNEVIENMKTGVIVPPADSKALAGAIEELLTNPQLLEGIKSNISSKYHRSEFSWPLIAGKTVEAYTLALNQFVKHNR